MAEISRFLEKAGRDQLLTENQMSKQLLGIANVPRKGRKTAISEEKDQQFCKEALLRDAGFAACVRLGLELVFSIAANNLFLLGSYVPSFD